MAFSCTRNILLMLVLDAQLVMIGQDGNWEWDYVMQIPEKSLTYIGLTLSIWRIKITIAGRIVFFSFLK
jgi:hypothetical protein